MSYTSLLESKGNSYAQNFKMQRIPIKTFYFKAIIHLMSFVTGYFRVPTRDAKVTHSKISDPRSPTKIATNILFIKSVHFDEPRRFNVTSAVVTT